jgi:dihydrofolate reductase
MGRKTWDSLPDKFKPLPDRLNIVVSSIPQLTETHDVIWVTSLVDAIAVAEKHTDRVFVIGGAMIYRDAMQLPGEKLVHLTRINKTHTCDKFFLLDSTRVNSLITHETNPGHSFHEYLVE